MMAVTSVNIGNRQEGRILSDTVISVKTDKIEIAKVIKSVLRKKKKHTIQHPFGDGNTSSLIFDRIKLFMQNYDNNYIKEFYDLDF